MTEHKDVQNPDDYAEKDYMRFGEKLFSPLTPTSELENICMTLVHLPTKEAQDLLAQFRESARASEVGWLDIAAEEGQFHYLSPGNEQEERDYLALKVMQEIWDEVIELEVKHDEIKLELEKREIRQEAIRELVKQGEIGAEEEIRFHDYKTWRASSMQKLEKQIAVKEKIFDQIKMSIKTERYKTVDPISMRHVHFT